MKDLNRMNCRFFVVGIGIKFENSLLQELMTVRIVYDCIMIQLIILNSLFLFQFSFFEINVYFRHSAILVR